jgi:hypothetical protein
MAPPLPGDSMRTPGSARAARGLTRRARSPPSGGSTPRASDHLRPRVPSARRRRCNPTRLRHRPGRASAARPREQRSRRFDMVRRGMRRRGRSESSVTRTLRSPRVPTASPESGIALCAVEGARWAGWAKSPRRSRNYRNATSRRAWCADHTPAPRGAFVHVGLEMKLMEEPGMRLP